LREAIQSLTARLSEPPVTMPLWQQPRLTAEPDGTVAGLEEVE
jgi:hypothetical protein